MNTKKNSNLYISQSGKRYTPFNQDLFTSRLKVLQEDCKKEYGTKASTIAEACRIGRTTLSAYTNGHTECPASSIVALAGYFDVSTDYLLGLTNVKSPEMKTRAVCDITGLNEKGLSLLQSITLAPCGDSKSSFLIEKLLPRLNDITSKMLIAKLSEAWNASSREALSAFMDNVEPSSDKEQTAADTVYDIYASRLHGAEDGVSKSILDPETERAITEFDVCHRALESIKKSLEELYLEEFNRNLERLQNELESKYKDLLKEKDGDEEC